ncbi:triacylglycerol lipase [Prescottella sp. R16]|uniref:esterase/lipase family protein n=1 Tax=Prescottella sp. R16 TaxID=3064529 RepID=UPI00272E0E5A|nr:alpha/beta fold hydrolase [Prescottella sp. R16]
MTGTMRVVLVAVAAVLLGVVGLPADAATLSADPGTYVVPSVPGPVQGSHADALRYARAHPGSVPAGVNDAGCRPGPEHPHPVVLVHGSDSDAYSDWAALAPMLVARGFCVFAPNYGADGTPGTYARGDMVASARQLADMVRTVRESTGAAAVDLVGYSQGATVARYFVNRLGGADVVDRWVGIASPTYGGTMFGLVPLLRLLPQPERIAAWLTSEAIGQQMQGSTLLAELNTPGDTVPGVEYTTIGSRVDEMIQPASNIALRDAGATNLVVQDLCPQNLGGHFAMVYDPFVLALTTRALDPSAPSPQCVPVPLGSGIPEMVVASHS